jgi:hypothetical protein
MGAQLWEVTVVSSWMKRYLGNRGSVSTFTTPGVFFAGKQEHVADLPLTLKVWMEVCSCLGLVSAKYQFMGHSSFNANTYSIHLGHSLMATGAKGFIAY